MGLPVLLNQLSFNKLIGDRPRIEYGPPKLDADGNWLMSGKLIVEFTQGPFVPAAEGQHFFKDGTGLAIAVPFADAKNERDAIGQAVERLRQVAAEIDDVAKALLTISQHNQPLTRLVQQ